MKKNQKTIRMIILGMIFFIFLGSIPTQCQGLNYSPGIVENKINSESTLTVIPSRTPTPTPFQRVSSVPQVTQTPNIKKFGYLSQDNLEEVLVAYNYTLEQYNEIKMYDEEIIKKLARTIYGEARRSIIPEHERAAVVWSILNRIDNENFGNSFDSVLTIGQFHGLKASNTTQFYYLAEDILIRWTLEKLGVEKVGRTLPLRFLFFAEHNKANRFRSEYRSRDYWEWLLPSPYTDLEKEVKDGD